MRTRTSTADLMPVVGFATRGVSLRTLLTRLSGRPLPLHVALDIALSVARLVRGEHDAGRVVGALDDSRIVLTESGMISLMAGGARLAPELADPAAPASIASDVFAVGAVLSALVSGAPLEDDSPVTVVSALPEELDQLISSCASTEPKNRPSQLKWVEKALAQFLTAEQLGQALEQRIELVKQLAPQVPAHLAPEAPMVIATEDVQSHVLSLPGRGRLALVVGGVVFGLLLAAGAWWFLRPAPAPPPVEAPAPELVAPMAPVAPAAPEPELEAPPPKSEPVIAKPAPVVAKPKKHRRH